MGIAVRKSAQAMILLTAMLVIGGCRERFEWNEKLTMTVETPDGEVSGSAVVRQVSLLGQLPLASSGVAYEITGEATPVQVAPGRYLFALLNGVEERAVQTFTPEGMKHADDYFPAVEAATGVKPLRGPQPMLVTFDDINDPKTVRRVDPDDLDATFGMCPGGRGLTDAEAPWRAEKVSWRTWARAQVSGVSLAEFRRKDGNNQWTQGWIDSFDKKITPRDKSGDCRSLKSITIEITDEKVTEGEVENVLGWLCDYKNRGARLNGSTSIGISDNELSNRTGTGSFKRGECK